MKIGIFNWRDQKHAQAGGAEAYIVEQAKIWANRGHEIVFFSAKVEGQPNEEIISGIKYIRAGSKGGVYLSAIKAYFKHMRNMDIIIDIENGIPFFTPIYSRKKIILLIYHINKDVWSKEFKFPLSFIGNFLERKLMPFVYKRKRVITISKSSKEQIREVMSKNKIDIVYCGINKGFKLRKKSTKPELVFVGRLKKYKSVDVLLNSVALVDKNLKVNIVGVGDDEKRLREIVKKLELKNIIFHGFVSEQKKVELLGRSWIAINPSRTEGWGINNIEANACGTTVIGSNVNGIKDSIVNQKTGLLFKYGDEKELAEKIRLLINNTKLRETLSKNALEWSKKFSWENSAEKFLSIIKQEINIK